MPIQPGKRLGPYEIVAPLGAGGMGEVYRARDTRLDRTVAIKLLPSEFSSNPQLRLRFEREAKVISSLAHPHICTLHDVGSEDGVDYLVMEHIEGETLTTRISRAPLPVGDVIRYGMQIADALEKAHRRGIVHRDLKPSNIMITKNGAKLLDFGLAKSGVPASSSPDAAEAAGAPQSRDLATEVQPLTEHGALLGTVPYMSPEQLEGKQVDARSDIFSLGVVLYEMASGRRAFPGPSRGSVIAAIVGSDPPPVAPAALDRVIRACLQKDPEERLQSAHDVKTALSWVETSEVAPARRGVGVREVIAWALAAGALVAVALLASRSRIRTESPLVEFTIPPPERSTFAADVEDHDITVSPDGRYVAFVAITDAHKRLWVRPLGESDAKPLAGTEGAISPFWSPDSSTIAFFTEERLKKIAINGGPAQTVCNISSPVATGAWSEKGVILFTQIFKRRSGIHEVPASGGAPREVIAVDKEISDPRWIHFLPGGDEFLFVAWNPQAREDILRAGKIGSRETDVVARKFSSRALYAAPGYLVYVRDATLFAQPFDAQRLRLTDEPKALASNLPYFLTGWAPFDVSRNGVLIYQAGLIEAQLVWLDRKTENIAPVGPPGDYKSFRLSPDGRQIAIEKRHAATGTTDLWVYNIDRNVATRLTHGGGLESVPAWSPDSRSIAFTSHGSDPTSLKRIAVGSGTESEFLPPRGIFQWVRDWSHDGSTVVYDVYDEQTGADIWSVALPGGTPRPVVRTRFHEGSAALSPDAKWIAFTSDSSGAHEVYVVPLSGDGERTQVSTSGGSQPRWSRDGSELFYISGDGTLMIVPVKLSDRFESGAAKPAFQIRSTSDWWGGKLALWGHAYDVLPDGQKFLLYPGKGWGSLPITVVTNWKAKIDR